MTRPRIHIHSLAGDTPLMTTCLTDDREYTPLRLQKQLYFDNKDLATGSFWNTFIRRSPLPGAGEHGGEQWCFWTKGVE